MLTTFLLMFSPTFILLRVPTPSTAAASPFCWNACNHSSFDWRDWFPNWIFIFAFKRGRRRRRRRSKKGKPSLQFIFAFPFFVYFILFYFISFYLFQKGEKQGRNSIQTDPCAFQTRKEKRNEPSETRIYIQRGIIIKIQKKEKKTKRKAIQIG